jgi:hypothetical protein
MSTQRSPKLPTGVLLCDAGTNSHCHRCVPTSFLYAAPVNIRISPPRDFTPHRYGGRIDPLDRTASQPLFVQIPIASPRR